MTVDDRASRYGTRPRPIASRPPTEEDLEELGRTEPDINSSGNTLHVSDLGIGFALGIFAVSILGCLLIVLGFNTLSAAMSLPYGYSGNQGRYLGAFMSLGAAVILLIIVAYSVAKKVQEIRMREIDKEAGAILRMNLRQLEERGTLLSDSEGHWIDPVQSEFARVFREVWLEPRNDTEVEIRRRVWGTCQQCGAAIIVADSYFCSNCGATLSTGTRATVRLTARPPARRVLREAKRSTRIESCIVCKMSVKSDEVFVGCPHCGKVAHKTHLLEWLHVKDYCPACRRHLNERELTAQIEQKFRTRKGAKSPIRLHKNGKTGRQAIA